jgi:hypothetical protein
MIIVRIPRKNKGRSSIFIGTQLFLTGFLAELLVRNSAERNKYVIETKLGIEE